jgi:hypothetical protein
MHKPTYTTHAFIGLMNQHADKRLVFDYDGKRIQPGYHVTEIKNASYRSLDCGARPQQWSETVVQLWDVADKPEQGHMTVKKFLGIYKKVHQDVGLNGDAEIKFEWGDANTPAIFFTFGSHRVEGDEVIVSVEPVRASCKPRDDWWMLQSNDSACCAPSSSSGACCAPSEPGLIQISEMNRIS